MANEAEKKRLKRNEEALLYLRFVTLGLHALYAVVRWWLFGSSFGKWLGALHGMLIFLDAVVVYVLGNWARDGVDLGDAGLVEYLKDIVHLSWIVLVLALITDWAFLLLLLAPIYAIYKGVGLMQGMSGGGDAGDDGQAGQRKAGGVAKDKLSRADRMHQMGIETRGGRPKFSRQ